MSTIPLRDPDRNYEVYQLGHNEQMILDQLLLSACWPETYSPPDPASIEHLKRLQRIFSGQGTVMIVRNNNA